MKQIVLFIDALIQGGAQRQLVGLAVLLQGKGYAVQVITYHDIPFFEDYLREHHIRHFYIHKPKRIVNLIWEVRQTFRKLQPDIVISYLDSPNIIACVVKLLGMKYRLIVSERNTTQHLTIKERLKFFLFRWADVIVPNSFSQEKFLLENYPNYREKIQVITNFVDLDVFRPAQKTIGGDVTKIIGVGRIEAQKNIGCLIRAIKLVISQGYDVRVDWYGRKTDLIVEYERMIKNLLLSAAFTFHTPTTAIYEKYQQSDVFCLPSFYEGYPNVICEAMACGLPVICSDVCDNPTIIEEKESGFLFNPNDYRGLADCIVRFITSGDEEKNKISRRCRELAEQKFCKEYFVNKYIDIIR